MYPVSHALRFNRLSILAHVVYLRRNDSPAPVVLSDAMEIYAVGRSAHESPMTHINTPKQVWQDWRLGDLTEW